MNTKTAFTVESFRAALTAGPYAWPGGYPLYFITSDGESLSFEAAKLESHLVESAIMDNDSSGWRVIAVDVNWEDANLICCHTNKRIPSAYAE